MRTLHISLLIAALVASLALAFPTEVQAESKKARARTSFKAGQKEFKEKNYEKALKLFKKANKLLPHPDILFMVAQCHRNLKQYRAAVKGFKGYLKAKPNADDRIEVKRLIDELEFLQEVSPEEPDEPTEPGEPADPVDPDDPDGSKPPAKKPPVKKPLVEPPPPIVPIAPTPRRRKTPIYKKWWFWAVVGGTVVVAGGVGIIAATAGGEEAPAGSLGTLDLR